MKHRLESRQGYMNSKTTAKGADLKVAATKAIEKAKASADTEENEDGAPELQKSVAPRARGCARLNGYENRLYVRWSAP